MHVLPNLYRLVSCMQQIQKFKIAVTHTPIKHQIHKFTAPIYINHKSCR